MNIFDSSGGIKPRNNAILRDYQKVTKLEQDINRKKYELSVGGWRTDKIDWCTLERMTATIKRYQELWIITKSIKITSSSEYWDLILVLWKLNASLKHFVSIGWISESQDKKDEPSFDLRTSGKVALKIESKAINEMKNDYSCTRRYACEQSWGNIKDERKKIKNLLKNDYEPLENKWKLQPRSSEKHILKKI
jgi:hypothetical protein